ncbi:MAG: protein kinase [Myxococcales bacterium]|nr:protein kinase [Myxococcales bacterium]
MASPPPDEPDIPDALTTLSGTVLENRYRIGRVLGAGGMGAVFEARHLLLDRPVAIKVLRPAYATEKEYIARFLREAKSASRIRHRNVVEILDYGQTTGGLVYSVMEFLVGQDLQELLRAQPHGRLPWARACGLLVQIASGLKAAHGQGVIHRDIKPANCFLTDEDGEAVVKLVDFGIAKLEGGDRGHTLTGTAQVLGTPSYIAPELVRSQDPASPRSDIYALGVVAYRMLAGKVPFSAGTVFELLRKACFDPVPSLRAQVPELPAAVEALVLEMLAKEPEQRPADMLAVRNRLVALSRQTLGAQAVEIPGSSGIRLDGGEEVSGSGAVVEVERTEVLEDVVAESSPEVRSQTAVVPDGVASPQREREPEGEKTAVFESTPGGLERPPTLPSGTPRRAMHDPGSLPPELGETAPSLDSSPSVERPRTSEPSRRRGAGGLLLGGVAAVALLGGLAVSTMWTGDDGAASSGEVAVSEARPVSGEGDRIGAPAVAGSVRAEAGTPTDSDEEIAEATSGTGVPIHDGVGASSGVGSGEHEPAGADDGPESVEPVEALPEPKPPELESPAVKPGKAKLSKPLGPPPDPTLQKRLQRKIKAKCAEQLASSKRVTVSFFVSRSGGIDFLTATPKDAAGQCAKEQVQGTKFRSRAEDTPIKIVVE